MLTTIIVRLVDLSRRFAWIVILLALAATGGASWFVATHFKINTNVDQLLSVDLPWRHQEIELDHAFPQKVDTLVVVIYGDTAAEAESAAQQLSDKLQTMPAQFSMVKRPETIPFFQKSGILLLPKEQLSATLEEIGSAQPMIGTLVSDPSLRGLFSTVGLMVQGLTYGQTDYAHLERPLTKISETVEAALNGKDLPLSLQNLMADSPSTPHDMRKFIITKPVLDYGALSPGAASSAALRAAVSQLGLTPDHGIRVRLTGPVALNDEEYASVTNGTGVATLLSGVLVFVLLLLALRSLRIVLPILITLMVGLASTTAFALLAVNALNLISVAFAVMFIGIAVDFGIQFGIRFRDQHHQEPDHAKAMMRTAKVIAVPLSMAAGSTTLGFFAFIPTAYRGVSELGLIAGIGMIIAFILNLTLLPALLTVTRPPAEPEGIGFQSAGILDAFLINHRRGVLIAALCLGIGGAILATQVRFDFDPLDLKDPHTESVSTLFDLMKDPEASSYTIDALEPSLADAETLAAKLRAIPQVDHVMTLASFVPDDQPAKLAFLSDSKTLLAPTLSLPQMPAPSEGEIYASMTKLSAELHESGKTYPASERLATALDGVGQKHSPELLARLQRNLVSEMQTRLEVIKTMLQTEAVTPETISSDLKQDWVTPDGRALVQVYPKGNPRDNKTLIAFVNAVQAIAPNASGAPISIRESGRTVMSAFIHAGIYAIIAISLLSFLILRRVGDVVRLLTPLLLAGVLTMATIVLIGMPLNFANIIALPLLLSLGVSYAIYFVSFWRAGMANPLQSSMARAVLFSAATVLVAFGSLALSSHPGTASMGELLTVSLVYSLILTFFVLPSLLGLPKKDKSNVNRLDT